MDFGASITGNDQAHARVAVLDETDAIYASVRDLNFARVGTALKAHAARLGASYDDVRAASTGTARMQVIAGAILLSMQ